MFASDLDGDGDVDVLSASSLDDKIAWCENEGHGQFGPPKVITTKAKGAYNVLAADLDGDGDADVLSSSLSDDKVAWYRNLTPTCHLIDFEVDDQQTPLGNGQDISTPPEFGALVSILGSAANFGAAIFDSDPTGPNAMGPNPDLLVDRGNVLILQQSPWQSPPGYFVIPNDSALGGTLAFEFAAPVEVLSIDLIDIDAPGNGCRVNLTSASGAVRSYDVPGGWTSDIALDGEAGFATLDLASLAPQIGYTASAQGQDEGRFDPRAS